MEKFMYSPSMTRFYICSYKLQNDFTIVVLDYEAPLERRKPDARGLYFFLIPVPPFTQKKGSIKEPLFIIFFPSQLISSAYPSQFPEANLFAADAHLKKQYGHDNARSRGYPDMKPCKEHTPH